MQLAGLGFGTTCLRQPRFFSELRIDIGQILPEPLVTLPAEQGMFSVVLPAPILGAFLLSSKSLFHP
jgi:hypothetical protein